VHLVLRRQGGGFEGQASPSGCFDLGQSLGDLHRFDRRVEDLAYAQALGLGGDERVDGAEVGGQDHRHRIPAALQFAHQGQTFACQIHEVADHQSETRTGGPRPLQGCDPGAHVGHHQDLPAALRERLVEDTIASRMVIDEQDVESVCHCGSGDDAGRLARTMRVRQSCTMAFAVHPIHLRDDRRRSCCRTCGYASISRPSSASQASRNA